MPDFRIGEKAVYPAHGVAEVIGIEKKEINTTVCSFYVLKVLATGMQILVPREKADQVGLRPVATSSEIDEVSDILREKDVHIDKQTWNAPVSRLHGEDQDTACCSTSPRSIAISTGSRAARCSRSASARCSITRSSRS